MELRRINQYGRMPVMRSGGRQVAMRMTESEALRKFPNQAADIRRQLGQGATGAAPVGIVEKPKGKQRGREESPAEKDFPIECLPDLAERLGLADVRPNHTENFHSGVWIHCGTRKKYKPDYLATQFIGGGEDGMSYTREVFIEIKGSKQWDDAKANFLFASSRRPTDLFIWAKRRKNGGSWHVQQYVDAWILKGESFKL
jgi:hypothetical protein